jgi:hypothetical protein
LLYNFPIMLKILAIVIFLAIVLPVYGQEKGSQTNSGKSDPDSAKSPPDAPSGTATCVVKEEGTTIECRWPKAVPEGKLSRLFSPENAPNIGLFFVGLGGIIAAGFTLRAINRQADLMKVQSDIQAAAMRQWLDVEFMRSDTAEMVFTDSLGEYVPFINAKLHFRAVNNTPYPLTVKRADVSVSRDWDDGKCRWESFAVEETAILSPGGEKRGENTYNFFVCFRIEGAKVETYARDVYFASVVGAVSFEPVIGAAITQQTFSTIARCGPSGAKSKGYWSKEAVLVSNEEYQPSRQNPN